MKFFQGLFFILLFLAFMWWAGDKHPKWKEEIRNLFDSSACAIIEAKFAPEQVIETNSKPFLRMHKYQYLPPITKLYPFLLLDIKYSPSPDKTEESLILWDLIDGEMVINTKDWKKTHGFSDCIRESSSGLELQILMTLAKHKGSLPGNSLLQLLHWDKTTFTAWSESCCRKSLITCHDNIYRIHMQDPILFSTPKTTFHENFVIKTDDSGNSKLPKQFSPNQIKRIARLIFGEDFAIRNIKQIFLPIYIITVQNSDNSLQTSYWNSLTGKQIIDHAFIE